MDIRYNLNRLAYFVATVDAGTITAAATQLGISKAVVSKQLQILEQEIGTPLLLRNTRHLRPTDAGLAFFKDAKAALTQANNAYERVLDRDQKPKGRIRVTAPVDYGVSHVAPFVARFQQVYPDVTVDLFLNDMRVDLIEERYDVGFRIGWLKDSSNLARKLRDFEEVAVCTPRTRDKIGAISPRDLIDVPFVLSHALDGQAEWTFSKVDQTETITVNGVTQLNITLAMRAYLMESTAFSVLPDFMVEDDLAEGRLVQLLPDWSMRKGGIFTVTPPGQVRSNALKRFLEMGHTEVGQLR
ncbi:LysR family transcriptional regulator [Yoonia sp. SS1-5]|uniref:LysR family transcriptional regulator n=1 Tax=Yoonia rhodophyticola TaxID=3137370 RepID=A0AAN0NIY9_9RHOB